MTARILIANRGEIARRIIRSAKERGMETVAVYSEADAASAHVKDATLAVAIGPAPARQSYLDTAQVLRAAQATGATAIHPGYGFLSENADFAEAVIAAGLIWIGPSPKTMRDMADKDCARAIAAAAGVPVVPGSPRFSATDLSDDVAMLAAADRIGYPLLVKAAAGGGGIGMRRVNGPETLAETLRATAAMALKSFGNDAVFLERFVPRARHVEIQVFGYGSAGAVHLFERDCSLQRRFQKVIEESPAPALPEPIRAAMARSALALCAATGYIGAGTVEFILDVETHEFYFLEMNTRIQVEHPVTECVTGTDLVGLQIDLALGRDHMLQQPQIGLAGHALQCRLYAENPARNFLPSPGPLNRFELPAERPGLRIETGYRQGDQITPYYDPMLAKLIVHAPDRLTACDAAIAALQATHVEGIATNRDFLIACLRDPAFRAGQVDTGFIDRERKRLATIQS